MKKYIFPCVVFLASAQVVSAQSAMDGFQFSQPDLKGTARFMSMGGAFGALGGDMTTLNQNPAGIGVYRSNEIGFTVELDAQSSKATSQGISTNDDNTPFYLNNIGFVSTIKMDGALKNFNIGFTYNKTSSFNRRYKGVVPKLSGSLSNYIATIANNDGVTEGDVKFTNGYDPYNPYGDYAAPWIAILGYDSYLITPQNISENETNWYGQWGEGTSGKGSFNVEEKGSQDEFNIALGGNISNIVYWGMDFGIESFSYQQNSMWAEELTDAYVNNFFPTTAKWDLGNYYRVTGTGFNYKLGVIVKPIQELRFGFAFHTPTWYNFDESYYGEVDYKYNNGIRPGYAETNNGYDGAYDYRFRTPWKFIFSAAGVIGGKFILSADYEIQKYSTMHFTDKYSDYDYDWSFMNYDPYYYTNSDIKDYYKTQNQIRIGAEYRVSSNFSLRAGYSYVSSPVKADAKLGKTPIYPAGTRMNYSFDNATNYITCGFGYHINGFYLDMAYVYKNRKSEYYAYPGVYGQYDAPKAKISSVNNQAVLSMGYKF